TAEPAREVVLNEALLERVGLAVEAARAKGLISGGLTASDLLRIPQALEIRYADADPAAAASLELLEATLGGALDALVVMRGTEGGFLRADLDARLATLAAFVDDVEREARAGQERLESRLRERIAGLPPDLQGDPAAIGQELVRFVARSDVD